MPSIASRYGAWPVMSSPASSTEPASGRNVPAIRLNAVLFPAPFGPMIDVMRFGAAAKLRLSTARNPPNAFARPVTVIMGRTFGDA